MQMPIGVPPTPCSRLQSISSIKLFREREKGRERGREELERVEESGRAANQTRIVKEPGQDFSQPQ